MQRTACLAQAPSAVLVELKTLGIAPCKRLAAIGTLLGMEILQRTAFSAQTPSTVFVVECKQITLGTVWHCHH